MAKPQPATPPPPPPAPQTRIEATLFADVLPDGSGGFRVVPRKPKDEISVKRQMAPAKDASREELADLARLRREHRAPAKTLFGEIRHEMLSNIVRDDEQDETTKEEGRFHAAALQEHKAEEQAGERKLRKIRRESAAIGASVNSHIQNPDRVLDGIAWEKEIEAEIKRGHPEDTKGESNP